MSNAQNPVAVCCGRPISHREFAQIRETVETFDHLSRKELIHTICEHLDWRTPSGTNKWDACQKMLLSFEQQGHLTLPAKNRVARAAPGSIQHTAETAPGTPVAENLKKLGPVTLVQPSTRSDIRLWNEYLDRYHYLGYKKPFGYWIRYFIRMAGAPEPLGCMLFSGAAKAIADRDRWIGWTPEQRLSNLPWVINNSRFLIFPWVQVPNLASHVLGKIRKTIIRDWRKKWGYAPVLMETFVDPNHYRGTCYLAANWEYLGMTTGKGMVRKNKTYRTCPKKIFAQPLTHDFRTRLARLPKASQGENQ